MVILGHVDAGKSTLMGQVLVQCGKIEKRTVTKYAKQGMYDTCMYVYVCSKIYVCLCVCMYIYNMQWDVDVDVFLFGYI